MDYSGGGATNAISVGNRAFISLSALSPGIDVNPLQPQPPTHLPAIRPHRISSPLRGSCFELGILKVESISSIFLMSNPFISEFLAGNIGGG
jgi:hypothetical protein